MLSETARRAARRFGDRAAFVTAGGRPLSYAEFDRAGDSAAAGLRSLGLGASSVIGLVLESGVDYAAVYLGAARIGAVAGGINPRLAAPEAAHCLRRLQPDLVVTSRALAYLVEGDEAQRAEVIDEHRPAGQRPDDDGHDTTDDGDTSTADQHPDAVGGSLSQRGRETSSWEEPIEAPEDDDRPVCVCFTSGSAGTPKGAWFSARQLRAVAAMDAGGAWGGGHVLASTNFSHVGFMTKLPWMLASGQTTHLLQRWSAGPALELIARHAMTAVTGVAPQIALMLRHPRVAQLDFSAVKAIVAGGSASPPELVQAARDRFGAPYSIRYSSTESGGVGLATALDTDDEEACHTVGRPRPGIEAEIRGSDGQPCEPGQVGELWLRSAAVMSGYWRDPAATVAVLDDGWLRTGDLASVDESGLYRLAGRITEMFIRGGYNVHPQEVEAVLSAHPDVAEAAVIGRPDAVMGEIGLAVVAPRDPAHPPNLEDLRRFAGASLARYKLPEALHLVDALPRNASHKLDRRSLTAHLDSIQLESLNRSAASTLTHPRP